jgi:hypothetical protein
MHIKMTFFRQLRKRVFSYYPNSHLVLLTEPFEEFMLGLGHLSSFLCVYILILLILPNLYLKENKIGL